jgi:hypothetical protein
VQAIKFGIIKIMEKVERIRIESLREGLLKIRYSHLLDPLKV